MLSSASSLALTIMAAVGAFSAAILLGVFSAVLIRRQIRLHRSIRLVELKVAKAHYWVFLCLLALAAFYVCTQLFDSAAPEVVLLRGRLGLKAWEYNVTLSAVLVLILAVMCLLFVLALSKSVVVDRGVYCGCRFLDWYHVHDYLIDEKKGVVVLSGNKYTFRTLMSTTPPLKVAKNDIPKLKFILNKNKNKFSGFVSESL